MERKKGRERDGEDGRERKRGGPGKEARVKCSPLTGIYLLAYSETYTRYSRCYL